MEWYCHLLLKMRRVRLRDVLGNTPKILQPANSIGILTKALLPPKPVILTIPSPTLTHSPTFSNCPLGTGGARSETSWGFVRWPRWHYHRKDKQCTCFHADHCQLLTKAVAQFPQFRLEMPRDQA